jgi:eukaryotic-like serine/threonine-protein kinase
MMSAADCLSGLGLSDGWKVKRHLARNQNGTGGTFSQSYLVEKDGKEGFLKAFDFSEAFDTGADTLTVLSNLSAAYNHERSILDHCNLRRLSNVVLAVSHGKVQVPDMGPMEGTVFYLIFEMADGDVRVQMDISTQCDIVWCLRALKDVSLGLWQVHKEMIAHQDAKPSNVLCYGSSGFKVSDFGRSSWRGTTAPHDGLAIAGDRSYAPPEQLYGFTHTDFIPRRMGCDLYMLGNLAAFLFSGINVTANLLAALDPQHHPMKWTGTYTDVLPYLQNAFTMVLKDISSQIDSLIREDMILLITQLCQPDLSRRGHSKGLGKHDQYSLERFVSQMDLAYKKLNIRMRLVRKAA